MRFSTIGSRRRSTEDAEERNTRAVALLESARSASESERRRLHQLVVLDYLDVADAVANRYQSRPQDLKDLRQVAYMGLTKAVQRFEPSRGSDIVSFAVPTISGEIKRYLRDSSWFVRPPRQLQELSSQLRTQLPALTQKLGHEPSIAEIAEETGFPVESVSEALQCDHGRHAVSLDAPQRDSSSEGDVLTLAGTLQDTDAPLARMELRAALADACRPLTPRERRILYLRFVQEQTQAEIARECGVTQMQISRLLSKIMRTLRDRLSPALLAA